MAINPCCKFLHPGDICIGQSLARTKFLYIIHHKKGCGKVAMKDVESCRPASASGDPADADAYEVLNLSARRSFIFRAQLRNTRRDNCAAKKGQSRMVQP
jgi:hypothetical protein